mgnify:CR=1 FL=1
MLLLPEFHGRQVGLLGLGPNGRAAAAALTASGANIVAWDGDQAQRTLSDVPCTPPRKWATADMAAVVLADGNRDGLSRALVEAAKACGVPVLTDLDLFARGIVTLPEASRPDVVVVTGAAGKSVTVSIIDHILREQGRHVAMGGPLGVPFLGLPAPDGPTTYLLELPVRRLSTARELRADVTVLLNGAGTMAPGQMDLALRTLTRVFKNQRPEDTAIIGVDDPLGQKLCTALKSSHPGTIIPASGEAALGHGTFALEGAAYTAQRGKTTLIGDYSRAPAFAGPHLNQDVAAAMAVCLSLGVEPAMIVKALHSYQGLEGRFECLGAAGPVLFVDDSYASSPTAAARAISACPDVFWIGGHPEVPHHMAGGSPALASLHGTYLVGEKDETAHRNMKDAVAAAMKDANALLRADPSAAPVILYAPGVPCPSSARKGGPLSEFRAVATDYIQGAVKYG